MSNKPSKFSESWCVPAMVLEAMRDRMTQEIDRILTQAEVTEANERRWKELHHEVEDESPCPVCKMPFSIIDARAAHLYLSDFAPGHFHACPCCGIDLELAGPSTSNELMWIERKSE